MDDYLCILLIAAIKPSTDCGVAWLLNKADVLQFADALVINIGDIAQVLSNDRYHAALHQVRASSTYERYSVPFFFNPSYSASYQPLRSVVETGEGPRYSAINWGEFRASRAAGDYADVGEEIQISDFRLERAIAK